MATPQILFISILAYLILLSLPPSIYCIDIHDVLHSHGLPAGLFPKQVKSFKLDENGHLEVFLNEPCLTKFENRFYFDSVVKGNLSYGNLTSLEGLQQEELFLWLPIKDIIVDDPKSGLILFDVGVVHKQFSLALFEDISDCKPDDRPPTFSSVPGITRKEKGFGFAVQ